MVDQDLLSVVIGIGGCGGLMFLARAGIGYCCRQTSNVSEDPLESSKDVGIGDDRDEEDSDPPAMG